MASPERTLHRQVVLLILLAAAAIPLFLFTQSMAERNRRLHARIGNYWFERGQAAVRNNDLGGATESFRRAAGNDHDNGNYRLMLARALAAGGNVQEAMLTLSQLRETAPENGEINLEMARVAATMGALQDAARYYRNALYGVWPPSEIDERRRTVRLELIDLLLVHGENGIALSELLLLSRDLPDAPQERLRAGRLFLTAGDPRRALDQFSLALEKVPGDVDALAGAGEAAFQLGDYRAAARYLAAAAAAGADSAQVQELLNIANLVVAHDPLVPRLAVATRRDRLLLGMDRARQRLETCSESSAMLSTLGVEADALAPTLTLRNLREDPELIRAGVNLIYRIEVAADRICGNAEEIDRALQLIGLQYGLIGNDQTAQ